MLCGSVPLKQWKSGFEETVLLERNIFDWLHDCAAIFGESRYFNEIHAYITAHRDTSLVEKSNMLKHAESDAQHLTMCDANMTPSCNSSDVSHSEYCSAVPQSCMQVTCNLHLPAAAVLHDTEDPATVNSDALMVTETAKKKHMSSVSRTRTGKPKSSGPQKTTRLRPSSTVKHVQTRRQSQRMNPVLPDVKVDESLTTGSSNSAGSTHCVKH